MNNINKEVLKKNDIELLRKLRSELSELFKLSKEVDIENTLYKNKDNNSKDLENIMKIKAILLNSEVLTK